MTDGAYLMDKIRPRCIEDGDCLIWTGRRSAGNVPRWGDKSLRRMIYTAMVGPVQDRFLISNNCENPLCVNPAHLKANTKGAVLRRVYENTDLALRRSITSTRAARKRAKLDLDKVREIRASDEILDVLAERYGVHRALISQVKRGVAWKETSSPFAGLGARP